MKKDGCALEYASEALRNDREIVLAAVAKYMRAFQYASKALRADRELRARGRGAERVCS